MTNLWLADPRSHIRLSYLPPMLVFLLIRVVPGIWLFFNADGFNQASPLSVAGTMITVFPIRPSFGTFAQTIAKAAEYVFNPSSETMNPHDPDFSRWERGNR